MSREVTFEGTDLNDARAKANSALAVDEVIISEVVVSRGGSRTVVGNGPTVPEAEAKARYALTTLDREIKTTTQRDPAERTATVVARDEQGARGQVALKTGESCIVQQTNPGSRGFLGFGRRLPTYELVVRTLAEVAISVESSASVRCRIGSLTEKYATEFRNLTSQERVRILREGSEREQVALLQVLPRGITYLTT